MNVDTNTGVARLVINLVQHYNHDKYWKMRQEVINPNSKFLKLIRLYYLFRIKRSDAFNNASMGTDLGQGAFFAEPPKLIHGLNGIVVSHFAIIGRNCTILQRVTIAESDRKAAIIGDNCFI